MGLQSLKARGGFSVVSSVEGVATGNAERLRLRVSGLCCASTTLE